ncbi:MAG: hypothetical protein M3R52_08755 [Acidobacteriota bacterium]|nr:hypothetical protein [Acidobacteriota bacterium]
MKTLTLIFAFFVLALSVILFPGAPRSSANVAAIQSEDKLVYADFETMKDGRPVSARGGYVQLYGGQQNPGTQAKFKGIEGVNAPELVHLKADDPNKAAMFSYELPSPNQYASVTLEIQGLPSKDGKQVGEDVSGYKFLTLQMYAKGSPGPTGVGGIRVEFLSHDQGIKLQYGFPQATVKLNPAGFNTYKVVLKSIAQPPWVQDKVDTKDVMKKLTAVSITVFCDRCSPINGTVVIDNVIFTN